MFVVIIVRLSNLQSQAPDTSSYRHGSRPREVSPVGPGRPALPAGPEGPATPGGPWGPVAPGGPLSPQENKNKDQ